MQWYAGPGVARPWQNSSVLKVANLTNGRWRLNSEENLPHM